RDEIRGDVQVGLALHQHTGVKVAECDAGDEPHDRVVSTADEPSVKWVGAPAAITAHHAYLIDSCKELMQGVGTNLPIGGQEQQPLTTSGVEATTDRGMTAEV